MGAPTGNKNAVANRGGGRKSSYEENRDAEWLSSLWNQGANLKSLKQKIDSGTYSLKELVSLKVLEGDNRLICRLMDKVLPDLNSIQATGNTPIPIMWMPTGPHNEPRVGVECEECEPSHEVNN